MEIINYDTKIYEIGDQEIYLENHPEVWAPHDPTLQLLNTLNNSSFLSECVNNKRILDIGTGSGILGIYLLKNHARYVAMTDINYSALLNTYNNLRLNSMTEGDYQYAIIDTDRFMGIQEHFDTIISNPPVQPYSLDVHLTDKASKYNENGNGRLVLDSLIKYGKSYLIEGGTLVTSCSSRHGHLQTIKLFNQYWGDQNWKVILDIEYEINPDYHGPYMDYWIKQQLQDGDLRVYLKNTDGTAYTIDHYDPEQKWYFKYLLVKATYPNN
jgi:methylase of polypeptide subunit release factors